MGVSTLTNLPALNASRHVDRNRQIYERSIERLASGKRINRASDDAAGSAISSTLEAQIRSNQQAERNALDALSLFQVAGGGMNEISNMLVRLRELAIQAASDTVGDRERELLEVEGVQLKEEIDRIAETTKYLGTHLLNGAGRDFIFQVGIENQDTNRLSYSASTIDIRTSSLGISGVSLTDLSSAQSALENLDEAMQRIELPRAQMGAMQQRLQTTVNYLRNSEESLTAANSRIRDADLARETTEALRGQILQKAGIAIMAQANMLPALTLKLFE